MSVVAQPVEAMPIVNLDFDLDGKVVDVEVAGATGVIDTPAGEVDFSGALVSVKEAA